MVYDLKLVLYQTQLTTHLNFIESKCKWMELIPRYTMHAWVLYHCISSMPNFNHSTSVINHICNVSYSWTYLS